jgi:hypothetical protein
MVGEGAKFADLLFNFVFGFIVGYKILGVFFNGEDVNPQEYIFSSKGSWGWWYFTGIGFCRIEILRKTKAETFTTGKKNSTHLAT